MPRATWTRIGLAAVWLAGGWGMAADGLRPASEKTPLLDELDRGFAALRGGDVLGALRRWTVGGLLENSPALEELETQLRGYREELGSVGDVHLIRSVPLGPTGRIDYLVIDYNRGPVYARFHLYQRQGRWVAMALRFSTKPSEVLPERLLDGS